MTKVMICIISFRRPAQLKRLLEALDDQDTDGLDVTVSVVDNDPAGSASDACEEYCIAGRLPLVYRIEAEPGIVAARNRCARVFLDSSCDFMAFIDDDEWPEEDSWLREMVRCSRDHDADIVAGDVISEAAADVPAWAISILYGRSPAPGGSPVSVFYTGNLLIGRRVVETLYPPFDERFALTGASDYHFALRCGRAGFRTVHAIAPVVEEFPRDRATVAWFLKRGFRSGAGQSRSHLIEEPVWIAVPRCLGLGGLRFLRGLALAATGIISLDRGRLVRGLFRISSSFGSLAGLGGITHYEYRRLHR